MKILHILVLMEHSFRILYYENGISYQMVKIPTPAAIAIFIVREGAGMP